MSNKTLKAFVRLDGQNRVIASSRILRKNKPKVGRWREIVVNECCTTTLNQINPLKPLMAFYSDGTIENGLLLDKSGNERHATLNANIFQDGSFENGSVWPAWNGATGITNSTEQSHSGTHSLKWSMTGVSSLKGLWKQYFTTQLGEVVTWSIWFYRTTNTAFNLVVKNGGGENVFNQVVSPALNTWVNYTGTYTESKPGRIGEFQIYYSSGDLTLYIDDVSVTIAGKENIALTMPNDAELKAIDGSRYLMYNGQGIPITVRTDMNNIAINNYKVFDGGVNKIIMLKDNPDIHTVKMLYKLFVNSDNLFDTIENVRSIKLDGTGDYTSIASAVTALSSVASSKNRFRLDVYDDLIADTLSDFTVTLPERTFMTMLQYFYLNGIGENRKIEGILPASSSDADIDLPTLIYAGGSFSVRNITFNHKNSRRYLMHLDNASTANRKNVFYKCKFNHLGCQEVIDYRTANLLPAPNLGTDITTFGQGIKDGQSVEFVNCEISGLRPFYVHSSDNAAFSQMLFVNSEIQSLPLYHATYNPNSQIKPNIQVWSLTDHSPIYLRFINTVRNSIVEDIGSTYHNIISETV